MVTSKRLYVFLMASSLAIGKVVVSHQLSHICAYSNESVARFRHTTLKSKKLAEVSHPGVHFDWPVDLCHFWISSLYGIRKSPSGVKRMHHGVDMAAISGTEVKAAGDGVVIGVTKNMPGYGNLVEVEHKKNFVTRYAHLKNIDISLGARVKQGERLGTVGATGNVRGADPSHLHFELLYNGNRVDPLKYLYSAEISYKNLKK